MRTLLLCSDWLLNTDQVAQDILVQSIFVSGKIDRIGLMKFNYRFDIRPNPFFHVDRRVHGHGYDHDRDCDFVCGYGYDHDLGRGCGCGHGYPGTSFSPRISRIELQNKNKAR
jgi:hypothetical protein